VPAAAGFHHPRQRDAHDVGCQILTAWPIGTSALEYALLCVDDGEIQGELLLREIEPRAELPSTLAAQPVDRRWFDKKSHQSFSMFTRNALNSGVRALASPTNGVSAFASQYCEMSLFFSAEMPTKPQWIGMPM